MDGNAWSSALEANPLDPSASWNNLSGCSQECELAKRLIASLTEGVAVKTKKPHVAKDVVVDEIDDTTVTRLVQELALDNPINPLFKHVQFSSRWMDYGNTILANICATIDTKRANLLKGGSQSGIHPLVIACKYM